MPAGFFIPSAAGCGLPCVKDEDQSLLGGTTRMDIVGGIVLLAISMFALAGIFWPRIRPVWRGTSVPASTVTSIGFALIFGGGGLALLSPLSTGVPMLLGLLLAAIGQFWDFRKGRRL